MVKDSHLLSNFYREVVPDNDGMKVQVTTLTEFFVVKHQDWTSGRDSYPYDRDYRCCENVANCVEVLEEVKSLAKPTIYGRKVVLYSDGTVLNEDYIIYRDGVWEAPEYDPRANDPDWAIYNRLKEKFE
jgi:hypothetical protein